MSKTKTQTKPTQRDVLKVGAENIRLSPCPRETWIKLVRDEQGFYWAIGDSPTLPNGVKSNGVRLKIERFGQVEVRFGKAFIKDNEAYMPPEEFARLLW